MNINTNEFNKRVGEILRIALHVESSLDYFIGTYFNKPRDNKSYFRYLSEKRAFFQRRGDSFFSHHQMMPIKLAHKNFTEILNMGSKLFYLCLS